MNGNLRIVTDSTSDLPPELCEQFKIEIVPLVVRFGEDVFEDGVLSHDEFWERAYREPPATSQPPIGVFERVFADLVERGYQVLCLTITGKHSGTFNSAWAAAQRFGGRVTVFDSWSISLGIGFQALVAAELAQAGRPLDEIVSTLERLRRVVRVDVYLETLEYLRRGGRAQAFISVVERVSRALNVKFLVTFGEGKLTLLRSARGSQRSMRFLVERAAELAPVRYVGVLHARAHEQAQHVARMLSERLEIPLEEILVRETGPALCSHAGPGAVGVITAPVV